MTCEGGPVRSTDTVAIAGGITLMLLAIMACVVCQRVAGDDFEGEAAQEGSWNDAPQDHR